MNLETIEPLWKQELIRRAYDREEYRYRAGGWDPRDSWIEAMWHVFDLIDDLPRLYEAGKAEG